MILAYAYMDGTCGNRDSIHVRRQGENWFNWSETSSGSLHEIDKWMMVSHRSSNRDHHEWSERKSILPVQLLLIITGIFQGFNWWSGQDEIQRKKQESRTNRGVRKWGCWQSGQCQPQRTRGRWRACSLQTTFPQIKTHSLYSKSYWSQWYPLPNSMFTNCIGQLEKLSRASVNRSRPPSCFMIFLTMVSNRAFLRENEDCVQILCLHQSW